jgi:stage V sporulation protein AC
VKEVAKPKLTPAQQKYQNKVKKAEPKPDYLRNALSAFFSGGLVCLLGQALIDFYTKVMDVPPKEAANPATATMILIGALLTGFGVFDQLAKYAGAGLAVPVTGFANSVVSAALEFREEGLIYGVCAKMFTLAGAVITFGVMTAFVFGLIHAIFH